MGIKHVLIVNEAEGPVSLTQIEVDYMIAVTKGDRYECKRGTQTSTQANLIMKIRRATGWGEMRPTRMFCRFAYKHGLVKL
jgi:hypothetical protein